MNGGNDWGQDLLAILLLSAISLGLMLPLVLLSFFQSFYRDRFLGWLNQLQPDLSAKSAAPPKSPELRQSEGAATAGVVER